MRQLFPLGGWPYLKKLIADSPVQLRGFHSGKRERDKEHREHGRVTSERVRYKLGDCCGATVNEALDVSRSSAGERGFPTGAPSKLDDGPRCTLMDAFWIAPGGRQRPARVAGAAAPPRASGGEVSELIASWQPLATGRQHPPLLSFSNPGISRGPAWVAQ